jgi:hypothetical protein
MLQAAWMVRLSVLCAAILLAGCIRYEEHVTFRPNGGGTFELKFGFDMTLFKSLEGMGGAGSQPDVDTSGFVERLGDGLEMESLSEELAGRTYEGFRLLVDFASADLFEELARNVAEGAGQTGEDSEEGGRLASALKLSVAGDSYTLTGTIPPLLDAENRDEPFARAVFGSARRSFTLTLPGRITASNADTQEGNSLVWTLDPLSTSDRQINVSWTATP